MVDRILNEPALVVGLVLAVLNLVGVDAETQSKVSTAVESVLVLLGAVVIRSQVSPVRSRGDR